MKKKVLISSLILVSSLCAIGGIFSYLSSGKLYMQYQSLWDYRRLHPDIMPPTESLKALSIWHDTTTADIMWIRLIQFIGDNIGNGKYLWFTHSILKQIQVLHPRFARAYEVDLLFLPTVAPENDAEYAQKQREILVNGLSDYEEIIPKVCDMSKVNTILSLGFGEELWSREDIKNPCLSGYIPYYMASRYDTDLLDKKNAVKYYKIASMQDDAPWAAKFLGILAYSSDGNYRDGALSFVLQALSGYDEEPYTCQDLASELVTHLSEKKPWTIEWIENLEKSEQILSLPKSTNNPLAQAGWTCHEYIERWIKQIYLGYITALTEKYPDLTTGKELIEYKLLSHIPTIQSQSWYTVIRKNNTWQYRERLYEEVWE